MFAICQIFRGKPSSPVCEFLTFDRIEILLDYDFVPGIFHPLFVYLVRQVVLCLHPDSLGFHPEVDVLGHEGCETFRIVVPDPHGGRQDSVILGVVLEQIAQFVGERMVELHLYVSPVLSYWDTVFPEHPVPGEPVQFAHEVPGVETQRIVAFLELVELLYHGGRYDYVIFLEMPYAFEVVQDNVCVKHEYLRLFRSRALVRHICISSHFMRFYRQSDGFLSLNVCLFLRLSLLLPKTVRPSAPQGLPTVLSCPLRIA